MAVALKMRKTNEVTIVDISGRITFSEGASTLRSALFDLTGQGQTRILLNLGGVSYIDSSGMGVLVSTFATLASRGGQIKLLNITKRVKDLLLITKLYTVFEVYEDEPTAIRSFLDAHHRADELVGY